MAATPGILLKIEGFLSREAQWAEAEAQAVAIDIWNTFENAWKQLEPAAWSDLLALVQTVLSDIKSNEISDILQAVVMAAESRGMIFVVDLSEAFLTGVISLVKLKATPASVGP